MFNNAEEAKQALEYATAQEQGRWIATMNTIVLSMFQQLDQVKRLIGNHNQALHQFQQTLRGIAGQFQSAAPAEQAIAPVEVAGSVPGGPRMGADGTPITDPVQLAAEEAMDAAVGSPQPQAPPRAQPRRRAQPGARPAPIVPMQQPAVGNLAPRPGADGSLITDAAQLEAEALMDAAAGPRSG